MKFLCVPAITWRAAYFPVQSLFDGRSLFPGRLALYGTSKDCTPKPYNQPDPTLDIFFFLPAKFRTQTYPEVSVQVLMILCADVLLFTKLSSLAECVCLPCVRVALHWGWVQAKMQVCPQTFLCRNDYFIPHGRLLFVYFKAIDQLTGPRATICMSHFRHVTCLDPIAWQNDHLPSFQNWS